MDSEGEGRHLGSGGETGGERVWPPAASRWVLGLCTVTSVASVPEQMRLGCPGESGRLRRACQAGFPSHGLARVVVGSVLGPCRVLPSYLSRPPLARGSGAHLQPGRQGASCCLLCLEADRDPWEQKCDLCRLPLYLACVCWEAPEKTLARGLSE